MRSRDLILLFLFGLAVVGLPAAFQGSPGYMDADYYFMGAARLASGQGFSELILWNYLDDPQGLPHPSHAYWMPLTSLISFIGLKAAGTISFSAGRLPFWILGALIPPLTATLSFAIRPRPRLALLAGIFALFPAFYLAYIPTTDTFGLYMLLGAGFFIALGWTMNPSGTRRGLARLSPLLLGIMSGLMHLARADGLLWLGLGVVALVLIQIRQSAHGGLRWGQVGVQIALLLGGYMLVMGPWFWRNLYEFGTPLSPGGTRAIWLKSYDELFTFPASQLDLGTWIAGGLGPIIKVRGWALSQNLVTALAVQGQIFLAPFILIGMVLARRDLRTQVGMLGWVLTLFVMTVVFPFPGVRGGFFHSGAAFQPLFWALAPAGFEAALEFGVRVRGWNARQSRKVFSAGLIIIAILLTASLAITRVIGPNWGNPAWNQSAEHYERIALELDALGVDPEEVVLVNNPPGFYLAADRPAIAIPNVSPESLYQAAGLYQAGYLIMEPNHPKPLAGLYGKPEGWRNFHLVGTTGNTHIFKIIPSGSVEEGP